MKKLWSQFLCSRSKAGTGEVTMKAAGASYVHFCWFVKDKQELKQIINLVPWLSLSQSLSCSMEVNFLIMFSYSILGSKRGEKKGVFCAFSLWMCLQCSLITVLPKRQMNHQVKWNIFFPTQQLNSGLDSLSYLVHDFSFPLGKCLGCASCLPWQLAYKLREKTMFVELWNCC